MGPQLILRVTDVKLYVDPAKPKELTIVANGWVPSPGWHSSKLISKTMEPTSDGIYEFDFIADDPPDDILAPMLTPIDVDAFMLNIPKDFKGVIVNSKTNSIKQTEITDPNAPEDGEEEIVPRMEVLMGVEVLDSTLKIRVLSSGCTEKKHFIFDIVELEEDEPAYEMGIYRMKPDECEALMREGVLLEWTFEELDLPENASLLMNNKLGEPEDTIW